MLNLEQTAFSTAPLDVKFYSEKRNKYYALIDIEKGLEEKYLNLDLIGALLESDIKNIYLITDMSHSKNRLKEVQALRTNLRKKGLIVHAVITPADYAWHHLTE